MSLSKPLKRPLEQSFVETAAKRAAVDKVQRCLGTRLFLLGNCQHTKTHNQNWQDALIKENGVEAGTLTSIDVHLKKVTVVWDCGAEVKYTSKDWEKLRVIHFAPTGYHAPGIICDVCQRPLMGFSFRCAHLTCTRSAEVVYDLCYEDYCDDKHFQDHEFRRIIPTEFNPLASGEILPLRKDSQMQCRRLYGLFRGAKVCRCGTSKPEGKIAQIVHHNYSDLDKAKYWYCVAEVDWNPEKLNELKKDPDYPLIGQEGKVEIVAVNPAQGGKVYSSHFPSLDMTLLRDFSKHWEIERRLRFGNSDARYVISDGGGECVSLHINLTDMAELSSKEDFWVSEELGKLKFLDLLHNRLESLPQNVIVFRDTLTIAGLAFNRFDCIPKQLLECHRLENLNLYSNQVRIVSDDISRFVCLTTLDLGCNKLEYLPDVFDRLPNLEILVAEGNHLTILPPSLGCLLKLRNLSLHANFLKEFPGVVFELHSLEVLTLANNRIQLVPLEALPLISRLNDLSLDGNPLQVKELVEADPSSMLQAAQHYLEGKSSLSSPSNAHGCLTETSSQDFSFSECRCKSLRVLVTGTCGSGKSSFVRGLCHQKYIKHKEDEQHDHTVGIDQYKCTIHCSGKSFDLSVWDFAGEKAYSMMNQIFLSDQTLICIVVKLNDFTYRHSIRPWLKAVMSQTLQPRLWIVCTHSDLCEQPEVSQKLAEITQKVREECEHVIARERERRRSTFTHHHPTDSLRITESEKLEKCASSLLRNLEVIPVTNTFSLYGHEHLKEKVRLLLSSDGYELLSRPLPPTWAQAERLLKELALQKIVRGEPPILAVKSVKVLLHGVINDQQECTQLLQYLHQAGEILLFRGRGTKPALDMLVLDPFWLISVFQEVFRHNLVDHLREHVDRLVRKARESGIHLTKIDIEDVANTLFSKGTIPGNLLYNLWFHCGIRQENFQFLMSILENFGLAYPLEDSEAKNRQYLFPWLLEPPTQTSQGQCQNCSLLHQKALVVHYEFSLIPSGFFEKYMVQLHHVTLLSFTDIGRHHINAYFDNLLVHIHYYPEDETDNAKIVLASTEHSVDSKPSTYCITPRSPSSFAVAVPFHTMHSAVVHTEHVTPMQPLGRALVSLIQPLENLVPCHSTSKRVVCPKGIERGLRKPHYLELEDLRPTRNFSPKCSTCHKETGDGSIDPHFAIPSAANTDVHCGLDEEIKTDKELDSVTLLHLASHFIPYWKELGRCLGLQDTDIQAIDHSNQQACQKSYQMLQHWMENSHEASLPSLVQVINTHFPRSTRLHMTLFGGILKVLGE